MPPMRGRSKEDFCSCCKIIRLSHDVPIILITREMYASDAFIYHQVPAVVWFHRKLIMAYQWQRPRQWIGAVELFFFFFSSNSKSSLLAVE
jgi:hypothetical protein